MWMTESSEGKPIVRISGPRAGGRAGGCAWEVMMRQAGQLVVRMGWMVGKHPSRCVYLRAGEPKTARVSQKNKQVIKINSVNFLKIS